jgi:hypothetical protein
MNKIEFVDLKKHLEVTESDLTNYLSLLVRGEDNGKSKFQIYFPTENWLLSSIQMDERFRQKDYFKSLLLEDAIPVFYSVIQRAWMNSFSRLIVKTDLAYSVENCVELFFAHLAGGENPKLVPKMSFPSKEVCAQAMQKAVGRLPFRLETVTSELSFSQVGSKLLFEVRGERGNVEKNSDFVNPLEAYWTLFEYLTSFQLNIETYNTEFPIEKFRVKY